MPTKKTTPQDKMLPADVKNRLDFLNDRVINLEDNLKRTLADYQNLEKRQEKLKHEYVKYANESLLTNILPILDDLERAQHHLQDQGLSMVISHLYKALEAEGVKRLDPVNQPFDHSTMECIEIKNGPDNEVLDVLSPGYLYHDRVLRHAKVIVGKTPSEIKN